MSKFLEMSIPEKPKKRELPTGNVEFDIPKPKKHPSIPQYIIKLVLMVCRSMAKRWKKAESSAMALAVKEIIAFFEPLLQEETE